MNTTIKFALAWPDRTDTLPSTDLRLIAGRQATLQAVREAASELYWDSAGAGLAEAEEHTPSEQRMLVLLTYFLAAGVYSLREMHETLLGEETLGRLARGLAVNATTIRLFCAHNPELLRRCLARVFQHVESQHGYPVAADSESDERVHRLLAAAWRAEETTRLDQTGSEPAGPAWARARLDSSWRSGLRLGFCGASRIGVKAALCALLVSAGVTFAADSTVGTSGLAVKDRKGNILITDATFRGFSGSRLIFRAGLNQYEYFAARDLDPDLLARLEIDPQLLETQAAEAAKRKANQDQSYAAHVRACAERQAKEAEQAARVAATRAAEIAEQQRAAREECRKDLFAWTMCAQANASMTAANAALIRAANEGRGPGIVVQSQAISSAGNQVLGPVSSGHSRPGAQPPVIRSQVRPPAPGAGVCRPIPGPTPRPGSPNKGPWSPAR